MNKYLIYAIKVVGILIIILNIIKFLILRIDNWELNNFAFLKYHLFETLRYDIWVIVGALVTGIGIVLSDQ